MQVRLAVIVAALLAAATPASAAWDDHFQGLGVGQGRFSAVATCDMVFVLSVERAPTGFVAVLLPVELCLHPGYAIAALFHATGYVYHLSGSWESGFTGTTAGSYLSIGPYGDGKGIAVSGCLFCLVSSAETIWSGTLDDLAVL